MSTTLDRRAVARQPIKPPSRARFQGVLDAAEQLILEQGLNAFSIPAVAERLGYTRASIYHFFPTPHALLNELSRRYYEESSTVIMELARASRELPWKALLERLLQVAAAYYNARPVARMLLLGRLMTDENFNIQEQTNQRLGQLFRSLFQERGIELPNEPDAAWIAVDIVDSILRHSQYRHDRIIDSCRDEALRAVVAYLSTHVAGI